ncbi:MAG: hypothetical protein NC350_04245 [Corallococcus sp.]|nr:hypothetical protein [Corallococcus sp.]
MKKRLTLFALALLVALTVIAPCAAFAEQAQTDAATQPRQTATDIYLIAPSSIAAADNLLFVADNIPDAQSMLHVFDVSGEPTLLYTEQFVGEITRVKYSGNFLFVVLKDRYEKYEIQSDNTLKLVIKRAIADVVDITLLSYNPDNADEDREVFGTVDGTVYTHFNGSANSIRDLEGQLYACICTADKTHAYWLIHQGGTAYYRVAQRIGGDTTFTNAERVPEHAAATGMLLLNGDVAYYGPKKVTQNGKTVITSESDSDFTAVCSSENSIYAIQSDKTVAKWTLEESSYVKQDFAIGSDTVKLTPPSFAEITSYTYVTAVGYPSNIIYKTIDASDSIESINDETCEKNYIVLGYPDNNSDYYYVMFGDKFGWVRKTAANIEGETKITINNTAVSDQTVTYTSKLTSANNVFVYHLPVRLEDATPESKYLRDSFTQTAQKMTEVTLWQQFTATDGSEWYRVSYIRESQTKYGFVRKSQVGAKQGTVSSGEIELDKTTPRLKINATLFDSVWIYIAEGMGENDILYNDEGHQIKLETGTVVNVLKRSDNASRVQVVNSDGTKHIGWVSNRYLIGPDSMTTNAIVGIVLLTAAVAIAVVAVIIYRRRKKHDSGEAVIELDTTEEE